MRGRRAGLAGTAFIAAAQVAAACGGGGGRGGDSGGTGAGEPIRFGIWGDTPYSGTEAQAVVGLVDDMNKADLDLAIFVGDIFGGTCDNREYTVAVDNFKASEAPLVYLPGDNEWTDCHPTAKDPLERLAHIRRTMFATSMSYGERAISLDQQRPDYPENSRWRMGSVVFVSLNVAGSNNNHIADPDADEEGTPRGPAERRAAEAEYVARDEADRAWLHQAFEVAKREDAPAIVVAIHADPAFPEPPANRAAFRVDGFDRLLAALVTESKEFAKPVVLVHGDSHRFRHDKPLIDPATGQPVPNFTRVETFGSPNVGWVEITLDPADPSALKVEPHLIAGGG